MKRLPAGGWLSKVAGEHLDTVNRVFDHFVITAWHSENEAFPDADNHRLPA